MTTSLARYDAACHALAQAKSIDEAKEIRDKAEAVRAYARQAKNRTLEIDAAEIRIRAERRLGELISAQKAETGLGQGRRSDLVPNEHQVVGDAPVFDSSAAGERVAAERKPTLADLGVDKKLSARAQDLAAVPAPEFESMVAGWRDRVTQDSERVTTRLLKSHDREANNDQVRDQAQPLPAGKFRVVYADPPWRFNTWSGEGKDRAAENHYPTMTQDEIEALPVADLAADDCVLLLWAVMPQLPEALAVIKAWGFEYKTCAFVWVKNNAKSPGRAWGNGYWTRANAELCLLAVKGNPKRISASVHQVIDAPVIEAPRLEHSRKPDEVAEAIERLVDGPYIELFCRRPRKGWTAWGAEANTSEETGEAA